QLFTLDAILSDVRKLTRRLESRVHTDAELQELERRRKRSEGIPLAGEDYTTLGAECGRLREPERLAPAAPPSRAVHQGKVARQLLSCFARVRAFERLLEHVDRADRHVALVEVLRISAHHERRRFSKGSPGLLEWLAEAY